MIAYKFLRADRSTVFTGFRWPVGEWVEAPVEPCCSGIHACRATDLAYWVNHALYEIELDGEIVAESTKVIAPRGRLLRHVDAWDGRMRDAFTRMCADRAHEIARADPALDAWDVGVESSIPDGPAMLGFMAAAFAEQLGGMEAYRAERARQAAWIADRL